MQLYAYGFNACRFFHDKVRTANTLGYFCAPPFHVSLFLWSPFLIFLCISSNFLLLGHFPLFLRSNFPIKAFPLTLCYWMSYLPKLRLNRHVFLQYFSISRWSPSRLSDDHVMVGFYFLKILSKVVNPLCQLKYVLDLYRNGLLLLCTYFPFYVCDFDALIIRLLNYLLTYLTNSTKKWERCLLQAVCKPATTL